MGLEEIDREDVLLVCGGIDVQKATTRPVVNWLRREARRGVTIGGLCTGAYALAKAGLLDGRKATIHWENQDGFTEEFEEVRLTKSVFVMDGNRLTTAGGTASIDMMLKIIARDHGDDIANTVADQLIYSSIRTDQDTQRLSIPTRIGVRHPKLSEVIRKMEANIEDPISPADLAEEVGMSTRQLERLFRRYLNRSPKRYYMELRLQKARNLLMQTDMSVINVALACGFASPSHFSKCYRAHYATTPTASVARRARPGHQPRSERRGGSSARAAGDGARPADGPARDRRLRHPEPGGDLLRAIRPRPLTSGCGRNASPSRPQDHEGADGGCGAAPETPRG